MHIEIIEGVTKWFFKTIEPYKQCPQCKKSYPKATKCRTCKIHTLTSYKVREGWIDKDDNSKHLCNCKFGSWFRFGKVWQERNTKCKHIKLALKMVEKL